MFILLSFIIKSICIFISPFLYYLINLNLFYLSLSLYFCYYDLCSRFLSCSLLLFSKLTFVQIKYNILKILWNICKSQMEFCSFLPLLLFRTGAGGILWRSHCAHSSALLPWYSNSTEFISYNCLAILLTTTLRIKVLLSIGSECS